MLRMAIDECKLRGAFLYGIYSWKESSRERGSELNGMYLTEAKIRLLIQEDYPGESKEFYDAKWNSFQSDREQEAQKLQALKLS